MKFLQKLLISMIAGIVLAGIIHLSADYYGPVIVCIEAGAENGDQREIYIMLLPY